MKVVTGIALLTVVFLSSALAQITVTPTQVVATADNFTCTINQFGGACTKKGQPYTTWTPKLNAGADASIIFYSDGNMVNPSLSMHGNTVSWSVTVKPNVGNSSYQSGAFAPPAGNPRLNSIVNASSGVDDGLIVGGAQYIAYGANLSPATIYVNNMSAYVIANDEVSITFATPQNLGASGSVPVRASVNGVSSTEVYRTQAAADPALNVCMPNTPILTQAGSPVGPCVGTQISAAAGRQLTLTGNALVDNTGALGLACSATIKIGGVTATLNSCTVTQNQYTGYPWTLTFTVGAGTPYGQQPVDITIGSTVIPEFFIDFEM